MDLIALDVFLTNPRHASPSYIIYLTEGLKLVLLDHHTWLVCHNYALYGVVPHIMVGGVAPLVVVLRDILLNPPSV